MKYPIGSLVQFKLLGNNGYDIGTVVKCPDNSEHFNLSTKVWVRWKSDNKVLWIDENDEALSFFKGSELISFEDQLREFVSEYKTFTFTSTSIAFDIAEIKKWHSKRSSVAQEVEKAIALIKTHGYKVSK